MVIVVFIFVDWSLDLDVDWWFSFDDEINRWFFWLCCLVEY